MSRPNLYSLDSWERHRAAVLEVLELALTKLASTPSLPEGENGLNRALLFRYREENSRLLQQGRGVSAPIYYECNGQPLDERERAAIEQKRPDFNVGMVDTQAGRDRFFYIEGKRLGTRLVSGWCLNEEYSKNGVRRFSDPLWGYGAGESSGAMVGYVQSMDCEAVAVEVNTFGARMGCTPISRVSQAWTHKGTSRLIQDFDRSVEPKRFHLDHFWVDVRHCPIEPNARGKRASASKRRSLLAKRRKRVMKKRP